MKLNVEAWKEFTIHRLFRLENGKANQGMLEEGNDCFYVGAKKDENGVMIHCAKDSSLMQKENCIIFICNGQGSVGYANYMDVDFIGTTDVVAGYNDNLNDLNGLFIATVLCQERPKYSFGKKWKTHLEDTVISLPTKTNADGTLFIDDTYQYSDDGYVPDWLWMEDYIKSLNHKPLTTQNKSSSRTTIDTDRWIEFRFGDLISDIYKAKAINKDDLVETSEKNNSIRYITRTAENNGCEFRATLNDVPALFIEKGNAISVGDTTATCFYQSEQFITGDHMVVIRADWLNEINAMFIVAILSSEQYKYSYGRAYLIDRIKDTIIKLPIRRSKDGILIIDSAKQYSKNGYVPDWQWMEDYIKSLPYGDRI